MSFFIHPTDIQPLSLLDPYEVQALGQTKKSQHLRTKSNIYDKYQEHPISISESNTPPWQNHPFESSSNQHSQGNTNSDLDIPINHMKGTRTKHNTKYSIMNRSLITT